METYSGTFPKKYGHRYNASNMDELGANWLREKKEKEKNKKSA